MGLILDDTFTEASGTPFLVSHTGETGATWTRASSSGDTAGSNAPRVDSTNDEWYGGNTTNNQHYYASASPANADQRITATFNRRASSTGQWTGLILRMDTGASLTGYVLFYINSATPFFRLYRINSGAGTQLGSDYTYTLPAVTNTDVDFYAVGSSIKAYLGSTLMISATDSSITSAGKLGIRSSDYAVAAVGDGVNLSRILGYDSATLPTVGASSRRSFNALRGVYTR